MPLRLYHSHASPKLLIGAGIGVLALGAAIGLTLGGQALLDMTLGTMTPDERIDVLTVIQHMLLAICVVSVMLTSYGLWLLEMESHRAKAAINDLIRQVKGFEEGDWHDDIHVDAGRDIEALGKEINALAKKHAGAAESGDAEEVKSRFLEIISHQLRTPLTAVRWNLEALLKGDLGALKREQANLLRITEKNYHGILAMLADWVEALEVERGLLRLNFAPVDVVEIVASMTPEFRQQASLKRQKLAISVAKDLPLTRADRLKLRFIINKLMSNAMDYTPEDGKVAFRVRKDGEAVRFEVQDSGIGIPDADQREIFKKFFRAGNATMMQPNASGVGLFVTRVLVEAHGGKIDFASTEGKGTTFTFTIPAFEGLTAAAPKPKKPKPKSA